MVELQVDALEADDELPRDCFVALRLGESQKLARLSSSRIYRFPKAGDCRSGKIEVFKRLGGATIDYDPENEIVRKVAVKCHGEDRMVDLCIGVERDLQSRESQRSRKQVRVSRQSDKMRASKDYLREHGVEARLAEAMQAVLRERPENPTEFLAATFLGYSSKARLSDEQVAHAGDPEGETQNMELSADAEALFNRIDTDHDGIISHEEFDLAVQNGLITEIDS